MRPTPTRRVAKRPAGPTGRTATVARIIDKMAAQLGRPPTDSEVAVFLATHPSHVRRHRALIGR